MKRLITCDKCFKRYESDIFSSFVICENNKLKLVCEKCKKEHINKLMIYTNWRG